MAGDPAKAASLAADLAADCERIFGTKDDITFHSRQLLAEYTGDVGGPEAGFRLLEQLIANSQRRDGRNGQFGVDARRTHAGWLLRAGQSQQAAREWEALIADLTACRGRLHANTLQLPGWTRRGHWHRG